MAYHDWRGAGSRAKPSWPSETLSQSSGNAVPTLPQQTSQDFTDESFDGTVRASLLSNTDPNLQLQANGQAAPELEYYEFDMSLPSTVNYDLPLDEFDDPDLPGPQVWDRD